MQQEFNTLLYLRTNAILLAGRIAAKAQLSICKDMEFREIGAMSHFVATLPPIQLPVLTKTYKNHDLVTKGSTKDCR